MIEEIKFQCNTFLLHYEGCEPLYSIETAIYKRLKLTIQRFTSKIYRFLWYAVKKTQDTIIQQNDIITHNH